jgi:hypothetical protein
MPKGTKHSSLFCRGPNTLAYSAAVTGMNKKSFLRLKPEDPQDWRRVPGEVQMKHPLLLQNKMGAMTMAPRHSA